MYYLERPPIHNVTVRLMVGHLLKSCWELGDWLWETAGLSESAVKAFIRRATPTSPAVTGSLRRPSTTSAGSVGLPTIG